MSILIRSIQPGDNKRVGFIIRTVLEEHGITMPGTVYHDESLHYMYEFHTQQGSTYLVAEFDGEIMGGAGIYPTQGLPPHTCELVKMYVLKQARGKGIAKKLMEGCMSFAQQNGYKKIYLETMPELSSAVGMYSRFGFILLQKPLGNTGHFACTFRMLYEF